MPNSVLDQYSNKLMSSVGGMLAGDKVFFHRQVLHDDLEDIDWFDLYIYGITAKRFRPDELTLLQTIWAYTSYPDSRLWNNRVAALAGTSRATGSLGISASLAVSEAEIYGSGILLKAIHFLIQTLNAVNDGENLAAIIDKKISNREIIGGYYRPLCIKDERIEPILKTAKSLNLCNGPHLALAFNIEKILLVKSKNFEINYGGVIAALAADLGLSPQQFYLYLFPLFLAGMPPCYNDSLKKPPGAVFPIACRDIIYEGVKKRPWKEKS